MSRNFKKRRYWSGITKTGQVHKVGTRPKKVIKDGESFFTADDFVSLFLARLVRNGFKEINLDSLTIDLTEYWGDHDLLPIFKRVHWDYEVPDQIYLKTAWKHALRKGTIQLDEEKNIYEILIDEQQADEILNKYAPEENYCMGVLVGYMTKDGRVIEPQRRRSVIKRPDLVENKGA